jgi:hypothetical protein
MNFLTLVVVVTVFATIMALVFGVTSMVRDGEVGQLDGEHWMATRVFLQVVAVLALVAAVYVAA